MPAPLDPDKREAIADAIRAGGKRNDIAREHDVSPSTVTRIGRQLEDAGDLDTPAFDRTKTKDASEAKLADLAERRTDEAVRAFDAAVRIRESLFVERPTMIGRGDDARVVDLPPAPRDVKDLAIAYGILLDKSRSLSDDGDPAETAAGVVTGLFAALTAERDAERAAS